MKCMYVQYIFRILEKGKLVPELQKAHKPIQHNGIFKDAENAGMRIQVSEVKPINAHSIIRWCPIYAQGDKNASIYHLPYTCKSKQSHSRSRTMRYFDPSS